MARKTTEPTEVILSAELRMSESVAQEIAASVPGEDALNRKVAAVALGLLNELAAGGMMLPHGVVAQLNESLGRPIEVSDILEQFERGTQRKGGMFCPDIRIDPTYEQVLLESAEGNGMTVEQLLQNLWNQCWDNGWFYQMTPNPRRILLSEPDYQALREQIGKDFSTGTELAAALREQSSDNFLAEV